MVTIDFQNFEKFCPKFSDFWPKNTLTGQKYDNKISTENPTSSWKMVQLIHKLVEM